MNAAPWLTVIGIGDDGVEGLSPLALAALNDAAVIAGGARHLAMLDAGGRETVAWGQPFAESLDRLVALKDRKVAILATGDPMWFGVGATLARRLAPSEYRVIPAPSAFSLAAARLGWALDGCDCLTVHGRPLERILPFLAPKARLLVYCHDGETPAKLAAMLAARGFGKSRLTALAHVGGKDETRHDATATGWNAANLPDLVTLAIGCVAEPGASILPRGPGLPDDAFDHDGKLTKRDVRAATLAALAPARHNLLWDVGAGSGAIAIEWCRAASGARAIAIEPDARRRDAIAANALALGTPEIEIRDGKAPAALADLPQPDAVFIGGGLSADGIIARCWDALGPGGRLVANAVTVESEQALLAAHREYGGEMVRIAVSHLSPVGSYQGWKPAMPVTQFRAVKP
jgi:precorrin-6Y C5,15-methyltransferase (decarboxylating)